MKSNKNEDTHPTKRKLRPGMGKAKGNGFENTIAKSLSNLLSPMKFMRTQGSGARVGGKNFEALGMMFGEDALKLFVGDVVPINEKDTQTKFKYSVECKFYATPDSFETLMNGNANIFKWMQESVVDASKINKVPILIFKWNRTPIYVALIHDNSNISPELQITQNGVTLDLYHFNKLINKGFWLENE